MFAISLLLISSFCNLHGKVKIVTSHGDYKAFISNNNPDITVKNVDSSPNKAGHWQFVSFGEKFTVQFVDNRSIADFTMSFSQFPRCRR